MERLARPRRDDVNLEEVKGQRIQLDIRIEAFCISNSQAYFDRKDGSVPPIKSLPPRSVF